jgi:CheY-like chemotaxis protein
MNNDPLSLLTPKILVVDDEAQIHATLSLRLGADHHITSCLDAKEALERIRLIHFDLCIVDIQMPHVSGLRFIEMAQALDPCLGFAILSAYDSQENLRRAIPLQVYDFIPKPLPRQGAFEDKIQEWVRETRRRRQESVLAIQAAELARERDAAQLERDVEYVASETAREALLQTANFLTTIHAHLASASPSLSNRAKSDPTLGLLARSLEQARRTTEAATTIAESFFSSAYASRDQSPALIHEGLRHAMDIALRAQHEPATGKTFDLTCPQERVQVKGLNGIAFLNMMSSALGAGLAIAPQGSTIGISVEFASRLELLHRPTSSQGWHWFNRKHSLASHRAVSIRITSAAPPLSRKQFEDWCRGEDKVLARVPVRGIISALQACHGILGFATGPERARFTLLIGLPC